MGNVTPMETDIPSRKQVSGEHTSNVEKGNKLILASKDGRIRSRGSRESGCGEFDKR